MSTMSIQMQNKAQNKNNSPKENDGRIILGIDPGYERLGISIVQKIQGKKEVLLFSSCVKTSAKLTFPDRLLELGKTLEEIIQDFQPMELAIENLFLSANQKTAMRVSETRGAIIYIAKKYGLKIFEYTPMQIKVAITGHGGADKTQIIKMLEHILLIEKEIKIDDEYDAIAIALTHLAYEK